MLARRLIRHQLLQAGSSAHFVDRDPGCFSKILSYLRNGTLFADKNCYLEDGRDTADATLQNDVILKDVVSSLETHGYVLDPSVEAAITAAGRTPTSWTFVKREG
ncbi:hypothetical protein AAVH_18798 [Aphelenchoides avenae]|nr:hypothetical protein AAVH_18798 [Aphelenchus avenae]